MRIRARLYVYCILHVRCCSFWCNCAATLRAHLCRARADCCGVYEFWADVEMTLRPNMDVWYLFNIASLTRTFEWNSLYISTLDGSCFDILNLDNRSTLARQMHNKRFYMLTTIHAITKKKNETRFAITASHKHSVCVIGHRWAPTPKQNALFVPI